MYLAGSVATTTANVLTGSIFEFLKRPSRISVGLQCNVAINVANTFSFEIQDQIVARDALIVGQGVIATSGYMKFPDDYHLQNEPGLPGDRLTLQITRGTGVIIWSVIVTEVV